MEAMVVLKVAVLTVSDTRTDETDRSGQALVQRLTDAGHRLVEKRIVPDDVYQIRAVVSAWIADPEVQVVISTGGTGFTGRDSTPEAMSVLFDKRIEGFGERFRQLSGDEIGSGGCTGADGCVTGPYLHRYPGYRWLPGRHDNRLCG